MQNQVSLRTLPGVACDGGGVPLPALRGPFPPRFSMTRSAPGSGRRSVCPRVRAFPLPSSVARSAPGSLAFSTAQTRVSCTLRPGTAVSTSVVVPAGAVHEYAAQDAGTALCPLADRAQRLADTELLQWQGEGTLAAGGRAASVAVNRGRGLGTWKSTWGTPGLPEGAGRAEPWHCSQQGPGAPGRPFPREPLTGRSGDQ